MQRPWLIDRRLQLPVVNIAGKGSRLYTSGGGSDSSPWPTNTPSYVTQIPNGAGFGMNSVFGSGRHLGTPQTTVYLINTLSTSLGSATSVGTRVYTCSRTYALQAAGPKVIIPIISGLYDATANFTTIQPVMSTQYTTWAGQIAPSPGFIEMNGQISWQGNNSLQWHRCAYLDYATYPIAKDQADTFQLHGSSNQVLANCSGFASIDECYEAYTTGSNYTIWQCLISNPFSLAGHPTNGPRHATCLIIGPYADNFSVLRTIMQHGTHRHPLAQNNNLTIANCLMYNAGTAPGDSSGWEAFTSIEQQALDYGSPGQNHTNIVGNLYVAGPSTIAGYKPIVFGSGGGSAAFPAGSQVFVGGNRALGASSFPSGNTSEPQSNLYTQNNSVPSGFYQSSKVTAAWATDYNEYVIADTTAEKRAFAALMEQTVGFRPKDRAAGWDVFSAAQAKNYIDGLTGMPTVGAVIDGYGTYGPSQYGTYPFTGVSSTTIDPFNSSQMQGDPLITVEAGRDVVQTSGLTWIEEWLQRWHFRRAYY